MKRIRYAATLAALGALTFGAIALAQDGILQKAKPDYQGKQNWRNRPNDYMGAIERTADMVNDPEARRLAQERDLDLINLTWEDTGRYKGSSVGPNISDMTIQVAADWRGEGYRVKSMPVIRFPNYSDKTADIDPSDFTLLVGNEKGRGLAEGFPVRIP